MIIRRFKAGDLALIKLQDAQAYFSGEVASPDYATTLEHSGQAFTGVHGGQVVCVAGCANVWEGRALAWAFVSPAAGACMVTLHRAVAGFLAQAQYRRIEAIVDDGFEAGHRWMRLLGFRLETPDGMPGYLPDGRKTFLYARVR